jgi:hypothetical protein
MGRCTAKSPSPMIFALRGAGFAHNVRQMRDPSQVKVLRVIVPQQRVESFIPAFIDAFQKCDWSRYSNGDDWP